MASDLQPGLFEALELAPTVQPAYAKGATIQERFEEWIKANPHFWQAFIGICLQMKRRGMPQWSSKAAVEVLRYAAHIQTVGAAYKIPNEVTSRLARKAMSEVPELDGFFELRTLQSE